MIINNKSLTFSMLLLLLSFLVDTFPEAPPVHVWCCILRPDTFKYSEVANFDFLQGKCLVFYTGSIIISICNLAGMATLIIQTVTFLSYV